MFDWSRRHHSYDYIPEGERPDFNDIIDNSESGIVKRGITKYLFSRNPERSVKRHKMFGAAITRAVIMGTYGRFIPRGPMSNYRTDPEWSRLESSTRFAIGGSVVNEAIHTVAGMHNAYSIAENVSDGKNFTIQAVALGLNTALVSLQRYNRARMVMRVNEELEQGNGFRPYYRNWLNLDSRALDNYRNSLENDQENQLPDQSQDIPQHALPAECV